MEGWQLCGANIGRTYIALIKLLAGHRGSLCVKQAKLSCAVKRGANWTVRVADTLPDTVIYVSQGYQATRRHRFAQSETAMDLCDQSKYSLTRQIVSPARIKPMPTHPTSQRMLACPWMGWI